MRAKFIRGEDPHKSLSIGKHRLVKKGETIEINYKGEKEPAIALDDEEEGSVNFKDFDGCIAWAIRDNKTNDWTVPSRIKFDESLNFERGGDPYKSLQIGKNKRIQKGDKFPVWIFYDSQMKEIKALSDEYESVDGDREVEINLGHGDKWFAFYDTVEDRWEILEN